MPEVPRSVSVVIPTYNDAERLGRCLDAVLAQTYAGPLEVIVCDNGSTDDTADVLAARARVQVCQEGQPGSYAARNRAVAEATGSILAFTDSDCIPQPTWIGTAVQALDKGEEDIVAGAVALFANDPENMTIVERHELIYGFDQQRYISEADYAVTANLVMRRRVFDDVGPFNAELRSGGDREWGKRALAAGHRIRFEPAAVVRHPARRTLKELRHKLRRTIAGYLTLQRQAWRARASLGGRVGGFLLFWARTLANMAVQPVRRTVRLRRAGHIRGAGMTTRMFLLLAYIQAVRVVEMLRLSLGGRPVR